MLLVLGRVEKALKSVEGVESAHVNTGYSQKAVIYAHQPLDGACLIKAVEKSRLRRGLLHKIC